MIFFILPLLLSLASIAYTYFSDVALQDQGGPLLGMLVGLALAYGHRFLRPIGNDLAAVSKYVGWAMVILFSVWLAFPKHLPWSN